jgi:hypothetical protein
MKKLLFVFILFIFLFPISSYSKIQLNDFNNFLTKLSRNLNSYEVVEGAYILEENEQIIEDLIEELKLLDPEEKIELFLSLENLSDDLKAIAFLQVLGNEFQSQSNLNDLNNEKQKQLSVVISKNVELLYNNTKKSNNTALELSKIVSFASNDLANLVLEVTSDISRNFGNVGDLSSNLMLNIIKNNPTKLEELSTNRVENLVEDSINELEYSLAIKNEKVTEKIDPNQKKQNPLSAISLAILNSNLDISNKITDKILSKKGTKNDLALKIVEQSSYLDEWKSNKNDNANIVKNNFTKKIMTKALENLDKSKVELAVDIIGRSNIKTSDRIAKSIIKNYQNEKNLNFFTLSNQVFDRLENLVDSTDTSDDLLTKSNLEAGLLVKSFYMNNVTSRELLENQKLNYALSLMPKSNFQDLNNISPN